MNYYLNIYVKGLSVAGLNVTLLLNRVEKNSMAKNVLRLKKEETKDQISPISTTLSLL